MGMQSCGGLFTILVKLRTHDQIGFLPYPFLLTFPAVFNGLYILQDFPSSSHTSESCFVSGKAPRWPKSHLCCQQVASDHQDCCNMEQSYGALERLVFLFPLFCKWAKKSQFLSFKCWGFLQGLGWMPWREARAFCRLRQSPNPHTGKKKQRKKGSKQSTRGLLGKLSTGILEIYSILHFLVFVCLFNNFPEKQIEAEKKQNYALDEPVSHWRSRLTLNVMVEDFVFDGSSLPADVHRYMKM